MKLGKRTAYAISAVIIAIIVGAFIFATVIAPLPAQQVPKVALNSKVDAAPSAIELKVKTIQLPDDQNSMSLQWACFSLSILLPTNSSGTVNLGLLTWSGNETEWLSIMPGYEIGIQSTAGNVSGMRVGDIIIIRADSVLAPGAWHFKLDYFPPAGESCKIDVSV
jgi:hypothetical protein